MRVCAFVYVRVCARGLLLHLLLLLGFPRSSLLSPDQIMVTLCCSFLYFLCVWRDFLPMFRRGLRGVLGIPGVSSAVVLVP